MPEAQDPVEALLEIMRLRSAYGHAVRSGDQASARAFLSQIQERSEPQAAVPLTPVRRAQRAEGTREQMRPAVVPVTTAPVRRVSPERTIGYTPPDDYQLWERDPAAAAAREELGANVAAAEFETPALEDPFDEMLRESTSQQPRRGLVQTMLREIQSGQREGSPELISALQNANAAINPGTPFESFMRDVVPFNPQARNIQRLAEKNPALVENIFNTAEKAGNLKQGAQAYLSKAKEKLGNLYETATTVPRFIAQPLGLYNPLVEPGGVVKAGSRLNPEAISWLSKQKGSALDESLEAMGGSVSVRSRYGGSFGSEPGYNIEFKGATGGYTRPAQIRKEIAQLENQLKVSEKAKTDEFLVEQLQALKNQLSTIKQSPLASEAIRYQLGRALTEIPTGSKIHASPIGGPKGERARLYKAMSRGALETQPVIKRDFERYPTETEFRAASMGGGMTLQQLNELNWNSKTINTLKAGPTEFVTWQGKPVEWNPETLKDPMLRAAFGLSKDVDVSSLRSDPTSVFINPGKIDYTAPVLTTQSPRYRLGQGVRGATPVGLSDLVPTREAIQQVYAGRPLQAVASTAANVAAGIPFAAGIGAATAAVPALAPLAGPVGGALAAVQAGEAVDEIIKQQTGEGIVSKLRQALGTAKRTGVSARDYSPNRPVTTPQIKPLSTSQRIELGRQQARNELQRRLDLFRERFNPAKGEFGVSELLRGR